MLIPPLAIKSFREGGAIPRAHSRLTAIRELLDSNEICADIVRYLVQHNEAADTARGIAEWWIGRDVSQTGDALRRLQAHGVVRSFPIQDATSVFAFTKNALLRESLRQYVYGTSAPTSTRS